METASDDEELTSTDSEVLPTPNEYDQDTDSSGWSLSSSSDSAPLERINNGNSNLDRNTHISQNQRVFARYRNHISLDDILDSIDFTISALYKIPIRKPTRMGHTKGLEDILWPESAAYEFFDIQFVTDVYRSADSRLQNRLGKLITHRRRALRFRRLRNEALQKATMESSSARRNMTRVPEPTDDRNTVHTFQIFSEEPQASSEMEPSVKATTFKTVSNARAQLDIYFNTSISEVASETSVATTQAAKDALVFPSRPKGLDGSEKESFECPYCCLLVQIRTQRQWE